MEFSTKNTASALFRKPVNQVILEAISPQRSSQKTKHFLHYIPAGMGWHA
jgi:hypothetical protein